MDFRASLLAASIGLASACGSSAAAPSPAPAVKLPDGNYLLAVYSAGIGCTLSSFGQPSAARNAVSIPVAVGGEGEGWHVSAREASNGSLAMRLEPTDVGVEGTAWGTLTEPGMTVTLKHSLSGTANGPSPGAIGSIAGTVNYAGSSGTAFCATNLWSLTPEP
jgi:hypothetical protein